MSSLIICLIVWGGSTLNVGSGDVNTDLSPGRNVCNKRLFVDVCNSDEVSQIPPTRVYQENRISRGKLHFSV